MFVNRARAFYGENLNLTTSGIIVYSISVERESLVGGIDSDRNRTMFSNSDL